MMSNFDPKKKIPLLESMREESSKVIGMGVAIESMKSRIASEAAGALEFSPKRLASSEGVKRVLKALLQHRRERRVRRGHTEVEHHVGPNIRAQCWIKFGHVRQGSAGCSEVGGRRGKGRRNLFERVSKNWMYQYGNYLPAGGAGILDESR
ncbi:hypothetical protein C8R44DRAFT_855900 [Mycena epipterygia]|nr:hypothetical protein C8R44DRAFT_855900 [Mycena epipterygia]